MDEKFKTENVATTNKLFASFLRYRGFIFTLSNGNKENPRIITFIFQDVPRYVIEEFKSGSKEVIRFKDIYNVRELVNNMVRDYQYRNKLRESMENEKSVQES